MSASGARPRRALVFGLTALVVLSARVASAAPPQLDPPSAEQRALDVYKRSKTAYDTGDFKQAVDLLREAYSIEPKPVILFNLARAYEGLDEPQLALDAYLSYLEREPDSSDRGAIEKRIGTLRRQLEERAALERLRGQGPTPAPPPLQSPAMSDKAASGSHGSIAPWVVGGIGLLAVGVGAGFGVATGQLHQTAERESDAGSALSKQSQAQTTGTAATVLFIGGGAVAAGGLTWAVIDIARRPDGSAGRETKVVVAPGSVLVVGSF